jgi:hypothetical protein
VRLNEKKIRYDRAESAQRGDKTDLSEPFAKIETENIVAAGLTTLQ